LRPPAAREEVFPVDKLVVIGGVAAGTTAAARASRCCKDAEITVFEQGRFVAYSG